MSNSITPPRKLRRSESELSKADRALFSDFCSLKSQSEILAREAEAVVRDMQKLLAVYVLSHTTK